MPTWLPNSFRCKNWNQVWDIWNQEYMPYAYLIYFCFICTFQMNQILQKVASTKPVSFSACKQLSHPHARHCALAYSVACGSWFATRRFASFPKFRRFVGDSDLCIRICINFTRNLYKIHSTYKISRNLLCNFMKNHATYTVGKSFFTFLLGFGSIR